MATDFFVSMFWIPVLIVALTMTVAGYVVTKKSGIQSNFVKLTGKRIFLGLSGVVIAIIIYSGVMALLLGIGKVELGHITYTELSNLYLGYWIYHLVLLLPFVLIGVVIIGLPSIFILAKFKFASAFGVLQIALALALIRGVMVASSPYNNWCSSNTWECSINNFMETFIILAVVALGFSVGAKLPAWRNHA